MLVLTTAGVPVEANLPFAGLHRLLRPVLRGIDDLPEPQSEAVRTAFGISGGSPPEPFLIALGVLGLISDAASDQPVLICVEDAHWLDRPTSSALAFAGRRIESDPVLMLVALRDGYDCPLSQAGMPGLHLDGLTDEESGSLLDRAFPDLPGAARARVLVEAEGNPLALAELPAASSGIRTGDASIPPYPSLTLRLEEAFAVRASELPASAQTILRVAAAADEGPLTTVLAAAGIVDGAPRTVGDLIPAIRARLVEIDDYQISFRHPLMRSALYQAASLSERHAAHAALAELFPDDADRRAWHRSAAATGPDPAISAEIEEAGRRALERGAAATAAIAFERAAGLERDTVRRRRLLLGAASAASDLGRGETATRLLAAAAALNPGRHERARWMWLEESFQTGAAGDPARIRELIAAASQVAESGDQDLALNLLVAAASRCYWGDLREQGHEVLLAVDAIGAAPDDQRTLYIQAFAATIERGAVVLGELDQAGPPEDPAALYLGGMAICLCGAFDRAAPMLAASARRLREQGRLGLLTAVLTIQAWAAVTLGDFAVALPAAEESGRLAAETQQPLWGTGARIAKATLAAMRGDRAAVEVLTAEADKVALPAGAPGLLSLVQYARGLLELGQSRHAEAYEQLRRIRQPDDPACHYLTMCQTTGDFTEAAVRSGHRDEALAAVRELDSAARQTGSTKFRTQMLLARLHLADDEFGTAIQDGLGQDLSCWPFDQARIELLRGERLRRQRRQVESRAVLRAARDAFDAIGASAWAERARLELRAAGESSPRRERDSLDDLTPQELQIVQMAAQGLTNGAIAQQLYVSRRTVESHLYHVFPKLGVSSRAELAAVLGGRLGAPAWQGPSAASRNVGR
jgi:DNA-binding CsgD family transcriptional regulator